MPFQRPTRALSVLASAIAAVGFVLAAAGCSHVTPLGPDSASVSLPPPGHLGAPIIVRVMRSQPPTATGRCPAGSVGLFGLEPNVPRLVQRAVRVQHVGQRSTATPTPTATPNAAPASPVGVACYLPVGRPITITSAAVTSVTTYRHQPGPASYGFVIAFPTADVAALTAVAKQAYEAGAATGFSVAGKLWQAPQLRRELNALRGIQINLLSRKQAVQLYRLLVPPG
jgi:hypothetical protein